MLPLVVSRKVTAPQGSLAREADCATLWRAHSPRRSQRFVVVGEACPARGAPEGSVPVVVFDPGLVVRQVVLVAALRHQIEHLVGAVDPRSQVSEVDEKPGLPSRTGGPITSEELARATLEVMASAFPKADPSSVRCLAPSYKIRI